MQMQGGSPLEGMKLALEENFNKQIFTQCFKGTISHQNENSKKKEDERAMKQCAYLFQRAREISFQSFVQYTKDKKQQNQNKIPKQ